VNALTIDQILRTLAAADSDGSVDLPWDRSIYSEHQMDVVYDDGVATD